MTSAPHPRDPDRLFPPDPTVRGLARELCGRVAEAEALFQRVLAGTADAEAHRLFRAHGPGQMARAVEL
jgi:hypothetical protein